MQGEPAFAQQTYNRVSSKGIQIYKGCTGGKIKMDRRAHAPRSQLSQPRLFNNDPSAGSPTETLLRLLLPLNDQV
jgi:hypothetical protein